MKNKGKKRQRHVPERSCIACRTKRPKRSLVRVVRTPDGKVIIDKTGKQQGRGAYLCPQRTCWEQALKRGNLNRALRMTLSSEETTTLQAYAATLPQTMEPADLSSRSEAHSEGGKL